MALLESRARDKESARNDENETPTGEDRPAFCFLFSSGQAFFCPHRFWGHKEFRTIFNIQRSNGDELAIGRMGGKSRDGGFFFYPDSFPI